MDAESVAVETKTKRHKVIGAVKTLIIDISARIPNVLHQKIARKKDIEEWEKRKKPKQDPDSIVGSDPNSNTEDSTRKPRGRLRRNRYNRN